MAIGRCCLSQCVTVVFVSQYHKFVIQHLMVLAQHARLNALDKDDCVDAALLLKIVWGTK